MWRCLFLSAFAALAGCVPTFASVYGLSDLKADSQKWPGHALVHYLSRKNSEPQDCVASNVQRTDEALVDPFVAAFDESKVPLERWAACATNLLATISPSSRAMFLGRFARRVQHAVEVADVERINVAQRVLASRPLEASSPLAELRQSLERAAGRSDAAELLYQTLELDEGRLEGAPLLEARVQSLTDALLLRRINTRHPNADVRLAARRRLVRNQMAASSWKEVQERAAEVEETVLKTGRWAQPFSVLKPPAQPLPVPLSTPLVATQDIAAQRVTLALGVEEGRHLEVRSMLRFGVGFSQPLALCADAERFEVAPCIDAREVRLGTSLASLDADGRLAVADSVAMTALLELARSGGLSIPVKVGEWQVQSLQLPLVLNEPSSFYYQAPTGTSGPAVNVVVTSSVSGLLVEAVDERSVRKQFVVPRNARSFEFGSRGGAGARGAAGMPGAQGVSGYAGMSATCPSSMGSPGGRGGDGFPGGPGGPGGNGGDGGPVVVQLVCGVACQDEAQVRMVFRSRGGQAGEGGLGGAGGPGGPGGIGGSGTSCYTNGRSSYLNGGSSGMNGSVGPTGFSGPAGVAGQDGVVQVELR